MSGGVDSSLAAALLKEEGCEVMGLTMQAWPYSQAHQILQDARQVTESLHIPFTVVDVQHIFQEKVISTFCQEYRRARTPNPCIICNREIKFPVLWRKAEEMGADFLASGHYARVIHNDMGRHLLKRGLDKEKDQSYTLYRLTQSQLGRLLLPLGDYTKDQVRELAASLSLPVHDRPESQEICFIPDDDYRSFLREQDPSFQNEGPILDQEGQRVGTHKGLAFYTIGQRRGLGISTPTPKFVLQMDPARNALIIGDDADTYSPGLMAHQLNWVAFAEGPKEMEVMAQIRYRSPACKARIESKRDGRVLVSFKERQRAITPGQSVVFYTGDLLLGGGVIEAGIME